MIKNSVITLAFSIIVLFPTLELKAKKGLKIDYSAYEKKGKLEMVLQKGHSQTVLSLSFSPDGKFIALRSGEGSIKLCSINERLVRTLKESFGYSDLSFSPDGKYIASGTVGGTVELWSLDGKIVKTFKGHSEEVLSVSFSNDGKFIVSGSRDGTVKLWTIKGELVNTFTVHSNTVTSVSFSPDDKYIASGSEDATIKIWDIKTGKCLVALISFKDGTGIVFTPDGRFGYSHHTAKQYVGYVKGMDYIDLNDIFEDFYTPGLLGKVLSGDVPE